MQHGTRRTYARHNCRCPLCRRAEATYRASLRARQARQRPILGSHQDARSTWRMIRALRTEGFSRAEIARRLGLRKPELQWHPERVTLRTVLRIHWLYRTVFLEAPAGDDRSLSLTNSPCLSQPSGTLHEGR